MTPITKAGPHMAQLNLPPLEPRYSCGHKRLYGTATCLLCSQCRCSPGKRRPVRRYWGAWLDLTCDKLMERR